MAWWKWVLAIVALEAGFFVHSLRYRYREDWKERLKSDMLWSQLFIVAVMIYAIVTSLS